MCVGGSLCVVVDRWLKKGFYLQHLWTTLDCPGNFRCVECLRVDFAPKWTKICASVNLCEGPRSEVGVAKTKDVSQLSLRLEVEEPSSL